MMSANVTLYVKPGCHLCEDVERKILDVRRRVNFEFEVVNILTDPKLQTEYGFEIPVTHVNGNLFSNTFLNETAFEKTIKEVNS